MILFQATNRQVMFTLRYGVALYRHGLVYAYLSCYKRLNASYGSRFLIIYLDSTLVASLSTVYSLAFSSTAVQYLGIIVLTDVNRDLYTHGVGWSCVWSGGVLMLRGAGGVAYYDHRMKPGAWDGGHLPLPAWMYCLVVKNEYPTQERRLRGSIQSSCDPLVLPYPVWDPVDLPVLIAPELWRTWTLFPILLNIEDIDHSTLKGTGGWDWCGLIELEMPPRRRTIKSLDRPQMEGDGGQNSRIGGGRGSDKNEREGNHSVYFALKEMGWGVGGGRGFVGELT
ncbi:hypothetical protein Tco_0008181 [Tanacetum coccineum]